MIQAERSLDVPIVPVPSPESLLEIQLSQPRPITARVTTTAGLADNHPAVLVQEIRDTRQRSNSGQNVVKEMASSIQIEESARESKLGPVSSYDGGNNAEQSDFTSDNQMLSQDFRGQLRVEQQIITASTAKPVTTEPVRQDVPEQVVLQVKERLAQHDLKSGNQQIRLILSPDNLGELKVNLNLQGQKLSVEIVTENRTVRDAIVLHTEALKESLARQNITMESFDVTTGGNNSEKQGQNQNAWRELAKQQQQQQFLASSRGYHVAQADLSSGQKVFQRQQGDSMLDIHY